MVPRYARSESRFPGAFDRSTPPELLHFVHERLPGSRFVLLDAAHISNVEEEAAFNATLSGFLSAHSSRDRVI